MPPTITGPNELKASVKQVADDVRNRNRSLLRELQIELVEGGVVLHGQARSFYGKQIAFHEVRTRCQMTVVANRIEVQEPLVKATVR